MKRRASVGPSWGRIASTTRAALAVAATRTRARLNALGSASKR
jgi:hypothetical protein